MALSSDTNCWSVEMSKSSTSVRNLILVGNGSEVPRIFSPCCHSNKQAPGISRILITLKVPGFWNGKFRASCAEQFTLLSINSNKLLVTTFTLEARNWNCFWYTICSINFYRSAEKTSTARFQIKKALHTAPPFPRIQFCSPDSLPLYPGFNYEPRFLRWKNWRWKALRMNTMFVEIMQTFCCIRWKVMMHKCGKNWSGLPRGKCRCLVGGFTLESRSKSGKHDITGGGLSINIRCKHIFHSLIVIYFSKCIIKLL